MKYSEIKNMLTQYDGLDDIRVVEARYIHAALEEDAGNLFIEALPPIRPPEDVQVAYDKGILSYNPKKVTQMSNFERMQQIGMLRKLLFPLPFHWELEFRMHDALLMSYRSRERRMVWHEGIHYVVNGTEEYSDSVLLGSPRQPTNAGVALIGCSGCGKSSAIDVMLSRYPQIILHNNKDGHFVQAVWLVVSCIPNSNFAALYQGIGAELDRALGYTEPFYEKEILCRHTLGEKLAKVCELVEKFAIGMIVFDEIQLIDFDHTSERSFDSLLTLANKTKVAIAVVGTEEAEEKMFKELRTSRRIGPPIHGDIYCDNKRYFGLLVNRIMEYQWFDEMIPVTQDIVDAFFDVTHGIVDQLVGVYSCLNYDYLGKKKRPVVNGEYVRYIAEKYYPGMQEVLSGTEGAEERIMSIKTNKEAKIAALIDKARQSEEMNDAVENGDITAVRRMIRRHVNEKILPLYPEYTKHMVETEFNKLMKTKGAETMSEDEIARKIIDRLQNKSKKRDKKADPVLNEKQMRDMLGIDSAPKTEG